MVPSAYVVLEQLPLTLNGKIDRRSLPKPEWSREEEYEAPQTPTEEILSGIWAEVLGVERVGRQDNFFALGGHSLLATQAMSRVRVTFGINVPLRRLFEMPRVAELAAEIDERLSSSGVSSEGQISKIESDEEILLANLDQLPEEEIDRLLSHFDHGIEL
jgi:acyl carrier protein